MRVKRKNLLNPSGGSISASYLFDTYLRANYFNCKPRETVMVKLKEPFLTSTSTRNINTVFYIPYLCTYICTKSLNMVKTENRTKIYTFLQRFLPEEEEDWAMEEVPIPYLFLFHIIKL